MLLPSRANPLDLARRLKYSWLRHAPQRTNQRTVYPEKRPVAMLYPEICSVLPVYAVNGPAARVSSATSYSSLYLMLSLNRV